MKLKLSERFRRPPSFLTIEPYLREADRPIASHADSRNPRIVPLVILDYGSLLARFKAVRHIGRMLVGSIAEMRESARSIRTNPLAGKKRIDADTLRELEAYAKGLGVTDIGYAKVKQKYIFRGFQILYENAIVFTMEMDKDKIRRSPSRESLVEIFRTYYTLGRVVNEVSRFLRERGYNAHAGPAVGGDVNCIPLARDAGLGEVGKNGLLITARNGPRVRLAAVYTDIENLPVAPSNPLAWVRTYCDTCDLCIEKCPVDAIHREPVVLADGGPAFVDHTRCALPFSNDDGCTICIKVCPFSYASHDKVKEAFERRSERPKESA